MARDIDMTIPLPLADESPPPYAIVRVPVLADFAQQEILVGIAQYVASQLHAGMPPREIYHRLHGYQRTEGE
jgi:hypothetical protein